MRKQTKTELSSDYNIRYLAFDNSFRANIISGVINGKIITANRAACKLLGYSKKELITKKISAVFDTGDSSFKKMLEERTREGQSEGLVTAIKKGGKPLPCLITSAVFIDRDGIKKSITTIADMSQSILEQKNIDTKKEKVVANNIALAKSRQKNIDIKKKKVVANNIALAKSRQKRIDTRKEKIVADNIVRTNSKQKSIDIKKEKEVANNIALARSSQRNIDKKKEKIVADNIVLAKSKQKVIDIKKEKIIASNIVLAQVQSDSRQEENNEWIKYIAKTSYDVMWDWNVATGQVYVGDSIREIFGYKVKNNTINFTDFKDCLLAGDKDTVVKKLFKTLATESKSWNDAYMLKRYDGSLAATKSRASIVRDKNGEAIHLIGNTQDVTTLGVLEKKLKEQNSIRNENNDIFQLAAKLSYDGIWDWNLLTNEFFLGEGFEEIFGNTLDDKGKMSASWSSHLHPEDKEAVEKGMGDAIASSATHWKQAYRFIKTDGSIANVFCRANIIRDASGKAVRMIGVVHDLSKQTVIEEKLEKEIKLKEMQIEEATKEAKENERSEIGKELHDNVNQLLGASKLYLDMAKRGGEDSEMYLHRSSEYTLTAIEEIRKLTKGLTSATIEKFGLYESIENTARDIMEVDKVKISFTPGSFRENSVNRKFKLNVFRIVQEGLNNILKHANATEVTISLTQNKKSIILSISDNGVGFDPANKSKGIGVGNIINRAELYNGNANFISQPGEGCRLVVTFPVEPA